MQRGLVHALAWALATGGAVTVSWWGVHAVLADTVYDPPRALPVAAPTPQDLTPSPHRPSSSAPADPAPRPPSREPSAPPSRTPVPSRTPAPNTPRPASVAATASGEARSYTTKGGRVVFELGADSAELVSATPEPDWSMQVWSDTTWIRVNFARDDGTTVSIFCTWNAHAPQVDIVNS